MEDKRLVKIKLETFKVLGRGTFLVSYAYL